MAPEHLFPAAVEDCVRVARYVLSDGEKHGIDRNKCAVAGTALLQQDTFFWDVGVKHVS